MAQIGIKLADGSFYAVMDDDSPHRKRVVLSTAREDQTGAQIDVIRRDGDHEQYVGCLVLEELELGEGSELELVIGLDQEGAIDARVGDRGGRHHQRFSVSLSQLDQVESYSLPDEPDSPDLGVSGVGPPEDLSMPDISMPDLEDVSFDDGDDFDAVDTAYDRLGSASPGVSPGTGLSDGSEDRPGPLDEDDDEELDDHDQEPRQFSSVVLAAIILIVLSISALGAYAVLRLLGARMLPELRAASWMIPVIPVSCVSRWKRRALGIGAVDRAISRSR